MELEEKQQVTNPFARVMYVMAKPAGAACNLACRYCYYLEKSKTLDKSDPRPHMSDEILEEYIRQYIAAQTTAQVCFTWHGGEATIRPLAFYENALRLQKKYAAGHEIINCLQTNATLLTDQWCSFLKRNNWLVGVSIDGPEDFHDEYRRTPAGKPTFRNVMRGIRMLQKHGVEWNAMAVVNDYNADYPLDFYHFFKEIGCQYIQFTPIVERTKPDGTLCNADYIGGEITPHSVTPLQWGNFLCTIFDEWVKNDVGKTFVQIFDATLAGYMGVEPGICTMSDTCGHAAMLEHNGDLYSCDHFAFPEYKLGNIRHNSIIELMSSNRQLDFGNRKLAGLGPTCHQCEFLALCHGECPKNRIVPDPEMPSKRMNYLCEGYRMFFIHSRQAMEFMAAELRAGHAPANIMNITN